MLLPSNLNFTIDMIHLKPFISFLRLQIKQIVDEEMNAANQHMAFGVTSLVLVLMISPIIIFLVSLNTFCILELTNQSKSLVSMNLK